jgi:hypothetical protein
MSLLTLKIGCKNMWNFQHAGDEGKLEKIWNGVKKTCCIIPKWKRDHCMLKPEPQFFWCNKTEM